VQRRLGWLHLEAAPGVVAITTEDEPAYVDAAIAQQLIAAKLARPA
jgi:hypothetical protein